jgi:hypothetical protein
MCVALAAHPADGKRTIYVCVGTVQAVCTGSMLDAGKQRESLTATKLRWRHGSLVTLVKFQLV